MTEPVGTPEAKKCPSCDQYTGDWCVWLENVRIVHGIHEHEAKALVDMWATAHARGREEGDTALRAIYEAAKVDAPDEGKHELAIRVMHMIDRASQPPARTPQQTQLTACEACDSVACSS